MGHQGVALSLGTVEQVGVFAEGGSQVEPHGGAYVVDRYGQAGQFQ